MSKYIKHSKIIYLAIIIVILVSSTRTEAFSINSLNPVTFVQGTTQVITKSFFDIINFIIRQKEYVFRNYSDPNNYPSFEIPTNIIAISSSTDKAITSGIITGKPASISATTLPVIERVSVIPPTPVQSVIAPPVPGLVVKTITPSISAVTLDPNPGNNTQILTYTNIKRSTFGLDPLVANSILDNIASMRADDLFTNQYFDHESPDGKSASDLTKIVGFNFTFLGENLALGNFGNDQKIVDAWMASPGHKANILNKNYSELGVAVKEGIFKGEKTTIAVQIFAHPIANCIKPNQDSKGLIDGLSVSITQMQADAQVMYSNISNLKNNPQVDVPYYNQKVQEYNYFIKKINDSVVLVREMINRFNLEVGKYNSCLKN